MNRFLEGAAVAAIAILVAASSTASASAAERLPRTFHGSWTADPAVCGQTGELSPMHVDGRTIGGYEHGWTIRTWSRRGDLWPGRGTADDDQGSTPATVRLRLRADGTLDFATSAREPFADGPGLIRCPSRPGAGR